MDPREVIGQANTAIEVGLLELTVTRADQITFTEREFCDLLLLLVRMRRLIVEQCLEPSTPRT